MIININDHIDDEIEDEGDTIPDPIEDCKETKKHTHPTSDSQSLRRRAAYFRWDWVDEFIALHENPDQRRAFKRRFREEPYLDYLEEFANQMDYFDWAHPIKVENQFPL